MKATKDVPLYISLLLLGVGLLFPWNAFITAADYFEYRYPGRHADRMFSICYLPTQLITLLLVTYWHNQLAQISSLRILLGFCGFTAVMILTAAIQAASAAQSVFAFVLILVAMTGFLDGIAQGALYGQYSVLPPVYTQAIVSGTAVSGTAVSILRVLTKAIFADSRQGLAFGAYLYFVLAAAICLLCVYLVALVLPRQRLVWETRQPNRSNDSREGDAEAAASDRCLRQTNTDMEPSSGAMPLTRLLETGTSELRADNATLLLHVARKTWALTSSLVVIYVITLAIFPGFLVEDINSAELGSWYPVLLIAAFNIADLAGKCTPVFGPFCRNTGLPTLTCSLLRVLFVPAFYLAAKSIGSSSIITILTLLLGLSNGFLTSAAMVGIPPLVDHPAEKNLAGNLSVLAMVSGLSVGAAGSFLWLL